MSNVVNEFSNRDFMFALFGAIVHEYSQRRDDPERLTFDHLDDNHLRVYVMKDDGYTFLRRDFYLVDGYVEIPAEPFAAVNRTRFSRSEALEQLPAWLTDDTVKLMKRWNY